MMLSRSSTMLMLLLATLTTIQVVVADVPPFPTVRFTPWDYLSEENQKAALEAGYEEKSWNKVGSRTMETKDWESLGEEVQELLAPLDLTAEQWDCYIDHYRNYDWSELTHLQQINYKTLGWSGQAWDEDETPPLEGQYWDDLNIAQQRSAQDLCYDKNLWDEVAIPLWEKDDGAGDSPEAESEVEEKQEDYEELYDPNDRSKTPFEGPASARNSRGIQVPYKRYVAWANLDDETRQSAEWASYNEKSWNNIGSKPFEHMDFELFGEKEPKKREPLIGMGFTADQWDCYMNHYRAYSWSELKEAGVQEYVQELGWDHKMWTEHQKPSTDGLYWPDLTPAQQNAAYELGYFRETWDEVSLQFWPRTTHNTPSLAKYLKEHPAKAGGAGFVTITVLVGLVFACCYCCRSKQKKTINSMKDLEMYNVNFDNDKYTDEPEGEYDDGYDAGGEKPSMV